MKKPQPATQPDHASANVNANANTNAPEDKSAEYLADLQRTRADFENFRKQVDLQREQAKHIAEQNTVIKFLTLIDDISRAIKANPETLQPVQKNFEKTLKSLNLEPIATQPGTDFDPALHEAVIVEDGEGDREVIAEELCPGYKYQGEVIRAAMVKVTHAE